MSVVKNIVAEKDMGISTKVDSKVLKARVPMLVAFSSEQEFENLLATGTFKVTDAPPPAEIKGPAVIPPPIVTPLEDNTISPIDDPPAEEIERTSDTQVGEGVSTKCPKCGGDMVLATDDARPGVDILYCPGCEYETVVEDTTREAEVDKEKPKRVYSRCPKCDKRKAQDAEFCKKCVAESTTAEVSD